MEIKEAVENLNYLKSYYKIRIEEKYIETFDKAIEAIEKCSDIITEIGKIKAEVEEIRTEEPLMSRAFECYGFKDKTPEDIKTEVIELLDERISELKGE